MDKVFNVRPYSINDFREWDERKELVLSPKFQRRRVWSDKAKSYLIDTILCGLPIPPIFIRQQIDSSTRKTIREVIDGQQRLGAILDYLKDGFTVFKTHNEDYGGSYFSELPANVQDDFLQYEIATNLVLNNRNSDVLQIFSRLNTYTVPLNKQELWNAKFFGLFKQTVHTLAYEFNTFWLTSKILSEQNIARMKDVELTSELIISSIDGIQDKKVIEKYYKKYEDEFPHKDEIKDNFRKCMDTVGEIYGEVLPTSYFNGVPLFYSLYCVIYDLSFGLKDSKYAKKPIVTSDYPKIKSALENFEAYLEEMLTKKDGVPSDIKQFIDDYTRHTTNANVRERRHNFLLSFIDKYLGKEK